MSQKNSYGSSWIHEHFNVAIIVLSENMIVIVEFYRYYMSLLTRVSHSSCEFICTDMLLSFSSCKICFYFTQIWHFLTFDHTRVKVHRIWTVFPIHTSVPNCPVSSIFRNFLELISLQMLYALCFTIVHLRNSF